MLSAPRAGSWRPSSARVAPADQRQARLRRCCKPTSNALAPAAGSKSPGTTVVVSVDTGASIEQVSVVLESKQSRLIQVTSLQFPLGLTLDEDDEGRALVAELAPGGNAEKAGVALGDVLRATTACMMQMTYPTMNLMFGGVGRPKLTKLLFPTTGQPFTACKDAIRSNVDFDNKVTLIFERRGVATTQSSSGGGGKSSQALVGGGDPDQGSLSGEDSVFDPRIFDDD